MVQTLKYYSAEQFQSKRTLVKEKPPGNKLSRESDGNASDHIPMHANKIATNRNTDHKPQAIDLLYSYVVYLQHRDTRYYRLNDIMKVKEPYLGR